MVTINRLLLVVYVCLSVTQGFYPELYCYTTIIHTCKNLLQKQVSFIQQMFYQIYPSKPYWLIYQRKKLRTVSAMIHLKYSVQKAFQTWGSYIKPSTIYHNTIIYFRTCIYIILYLYMDVLLSINVQKLHICWSANRL